MKKIAREMYIFRKHLDLMEELESRSAVALDSKEKRLLRDVINSLQNQLKILNNSIPKLAEGISIYKKLTSDNSAPETRKISKNLVQVKYSLPESNDKISLVISDKEKKEFLENLSKSHTSMNQLKKRYSIEKIVPVYNFGKPNVFTAISNKLFRNISNNLVAKGYFGRLNRDLRKMNSAFLTSSYVSMLFFSVLLSFILSIFLAVFLMFFNVSVLYPFITKIPGGESLILRAVKLAGLILVIPLITGFLFYIYPKSEAKNIGKKIDQELPFVTIHMSAIATSGIEPLTIFNIILKNEDYKYTNSEFRKIINLVNFQGKDLVSALKTGAKTCPSPRLKELFDGLATSITSGGSLTQFLNKHAENLLFDYKLERERYTKVSETFMDIYISIVIAAPMILLMLFVIMGSTGTLSNFVGMTLDAVNILIIMIIIFLNIGFLIFLKFKQPSM